MHKNNKSYYLHHLGLSNWQLKVPNLTTLKLEAQFCLLPKDAKYIFIIASPFDVASQLEQFLISVAYSLELKGNEFGYLIFNVHKNETAKLSLDLLNAAIKNKTIKIVVLAQESILNKFNYLKNSSMDISFLTINGNSILQTSVIKKNLMQLLINKRSA